MECKTILDCIKKYGTIPFFSKYNCNKGYCVCTIPKILDILVILFICYLMIYILYKKIKKKMIKK